MQKIWQLLSSTIPTSIDELKKILLHNRGITDHHTYLTPDLKHINFDLPNLPEASLRLQIAIRDQQKIVVFGDYDVDGLCSTTIMWETLHTLGADVVPYIPHREKEGYGLSLSAIQSVITTHQPNLIITVDCGISSINEIALAQNQGIDVIVTDHHSKPPQLPDCLIVHDHQVCGASVAYKVTQKLLADLNHPEPKYSFQDHLGLAALGTVCDIIPLTAQNRTIVILGLNQLRLSARPGLQAIYNQASIDQSKLDTYHLGYLIGPRLNAQGRLDHAMEALRLLCTTSTDRANTLATNIVDVNQERQALTKELSDLATQKAQDHADHNILIIGDPTWNPGVIGLIASHLVKKFHKPAIVWGSSLEHPDIYKASARSIENFNIIEHIRQFKDCLLGHGGHPMAAGLSLTKQNLTEFTSKSQSSAQSQITKDQLIPTIKIDANLPPHLINTETVKSLSSLAPFGAQYPEPTLQFSNLKVLQAKRLGKSGSHLKLSLTSTDHNIHDAIGWGMGDQIDNLAQNLTIAGKLETNTYNGTTKPQLIISEYKAA